MSIAAIEGSTAQCLNYEPTKVTITGWVFERADWGPPNYGEDPAHDSRERHDYVRLDKPICVVGSSHSDLDDQTETGVKLMELSWDPKGVPFPPAIGRRVVLRGTLFHGFDAHHHTPVLLWVTAVDPSAAHRRSN